MPAAFLFSVAMTQQRWHRAPALASGARNILGSRIREASDATL
jgi:hypothetical protein